MLLVKIKRQEIVLGLCIGITDFISLKKIAGNLKNLKMLKKVLRNLKSTVGFVRYNTTLAANKKENESNKIQAWQIHSYGDLQELKLYNVRSPIISKRNEVLVEVEAASVNPIDVAMLGGYGATTINLMRKARNMTGMNLIDSSIEFPLTMGRDFAGTVIAKGHGVESRLQLGDKVWGVVPIERQGCHASHVLVEDNLVNHRPTNLSHIEAASILYAGLTAWSALWITGGLCYKIAINTRLNKPALILGGSGGVGSIAIQLLKSWNMHVVTTCSHDVVTTLEQLGADVVIDYKEEGADAKIFSEGPYDIILDCSNQGAEAIKAKGYPHSNYITLNSPLLKNIDENGLVGGMMMNIGDLMKHYIPLPNNKSFVKWGFFAPCRSGIEALQELVENEKIVPYVSEVYPFMELPKAYERVAQGHLRGKIVIDMK